MPVEKERERERERERESRGKEGCRVKIVKWIEVVVIAHLHTRFEFVDRILFCLLVQILFACPLHVVIHFLVAADHGNQQERQDER